MRKCIKKFLTCYLLLRDELTQNETTRNNPLYPFSFCGVECSCSLVWFLWLGGSELDSRCQPRRGLSRLLCCVVKSEKEMGNHRVVMRKAKAESESWFC